MSEQKTNRKPFIVLAVLLSLAVIAIAVLTITYLDTDRQLAQTNDDLLEMTALQETTADTLASTEGMLAETQTALADMTFLQETTAATLATTESTLAETQNALANMTTLQETTAADLETTTYMLVKNKLVLGEITAMQQKTAIALATTETTLAETQTALAEMTTLQEKTVAALATTETTLAETQTALADMTTLQETTAATLVTTETTLAETQTALAEMTTLQETTATILATTEAELLKTQNELKTANEKKGLEGIEEPSSAEISMIPSDFIAGYEKAVFEKYNSFASENGLGGSKIYFLCTLDKVEILKADGTTSLIGYVTDDTDNKWLVHLHVYPIVSKTSFDSYVGKEVAIRGVYEGYSGVKEMPAIVLDELIVLETGENAVGMQKLLDY